MIFILFPGTEFNGTFGFNYPGPITLNEASDYYGIYVWDVPLPIGNYRKVLWACTPYPQLRRRALSSNNTFDSPQVVNTFHSPVVVDNDEETVPLGVGSYTIQTYIEPEQVSDPEEEQLYIQAKLVTFPSLFPTRGVTDKTCIPTGSK